MLRCMFLFTIRAVAFVLLRWQTVAMFASISRYIHTTLVCSFQVTYNIAYIIRSFVACPQRLPIEVWVVERDFFKTSRFIGNSVVICCVLPKQIKRYWQLTITNEFEQKVFFDKTCMSNTLAYREEFIEKPRETIENRENAEHKILSVCHCLTTVS